VAGRFGIGGWEEAKKHIREKHLNKNGNKKRRRRKSGVVRSSSSSNIDSLLLEDQEVSYPGEEEGFVLA